jgi:hypothetical protein
MRVAGMVSEDEKKIVLERLRKMPPTLKLSIGKFGSYDREQLMREIEGDTEMGRMFVEMHMKYIRSFKEGLK